MEKKKWQQCDTPGMALGLHSDNVHVAGDWDAEKDEAVKRLKVWKGN